MQQRLSSAPRYLIAAFLPVALFLILALVLALAVGPPWQQAATNASYFLGLVIPCFLTGLLPPAERALGTGALAVLVISIWSAGTLALAHGVGWVLLGAPAAVAVLASILWTQERRLPRKQRHAVWVGSALFLILIYSSDLTGLWFALLVIGTLTLGALSIVRRRLRLPPRYAQALATFELFHLSALTLCIGLAVGLLEEILPWYISDPGLRPGIAAAAVTLLLCALASRRTPLRQYVLLWSAVTWLMVLVVGMALLLQPSAWWEWLALGATFLLVLFAALLARKTPHRLRSP